MKSHIGGLLFVLVPVLTAGLASAAGPTAAVLEKADQWTKLTGAAKTLEKAGFRVESLSYDGLSKELKYDLIVIGSFASDDVKYGELVSKNAAALAAFVENGGVLLQFTQADQTEAAPAFLPKGLVARRCDADIDELRVLAPQHPLLAGMKFEGDEKSPRLKIPAHAGRVGSWESLCQQDGFNVLISCDGQNRFVAMLEGEYGKGRVLLTSLYLDKLYDGAGKNVASEQYNAISEKFFSNLAGYVELVKAGKAPKVVPTPAYKEPQPAEFKEGSWTLAILPDTQNYSADIPQLFESQTKWIVANRDKYNIAYVLQLGDITNDNNPPQWENAKKAISILDGQVPYALVQGNHDCGVPGEEGWRSVSRLSEYFPVSHFKDWPTFGGTFEKDKLDNSYHLFTAGGTGWIVIALEFGPRDAVIEWAGKLLDEYKNRRAIIIMHAYTYMDDTRYDWATKGANQAWNPHSYPCQNEPGGVNDAEEMWNKVFKKHANLTFVISGHVLGDGLGRLESKGDNGNTVYQMLVNYQMLPRGGDGFLRLMEFHPDGKTVQVTAYSPDLNKYKTDEQNQFTITLDQPLKAWTGSPLPKKQDKAEK